MSPTIIFIPPVSLSRSCQRIFLISECSKTNKLHFRWKFESSIIETKWTYFHDIGVYRDSVNNIYEQWLSTISVILFPWFISTVRKLRTDKWNVTKVNSVLSVKLLLYVVSHWQIMNILVSISIIAVGLVPGRSVHSPRLPVPQYSRIFWRILFCFVSDIPQIKRRIHRYNPPVVEAPGSSAIGSIAMIFVIVFLSGIFILDLVNIKNALGMMFKNIRSFCRYYCCSSRSSLYSPTPSKQSDHLDSGSDDDDSVRDRASVENQKSRSPSISSLLSNHVSQCVTPTQTVPNDAQMELVRNSLSLPSNSTLPVASHPSPSSRSFTGSAGSVKTGSIGSGSSSDHVTLELTDHVIPDQAAVYHVTTPCSVDSHVTSDSLVNGNDADTTINAIEPEEKIVFVWSEMSTFL